MHLHQRLIALAGGLSIVALSAVRAPAVAEDPFLFWQPSVSITGADRRLLERGEPVARVLPGSGGEVAIVAIVPVAADGDRLVAWVRQIADFKRSTYVQAIGRFSDPPRLDDLAGLSLDDRDVSAIPECEPGHCGLKLSASEMHQLRDVIDVSAPDWPAAAQQAFRQLVLQRVEAYLAGGHAALSGYENRDDPVLLQPAFARILQGSVFLAQHVPQFAAYLERFPDAPLSDVESFLYWSKESFNGKPIVRATHVAILRGTGTDTPDALVAGKEIFSTHYVNGSLGITAIVRGETGSANYLVYFNRSDVDLLGGPFGGLVRWVVRGRLKAEALSVLRGLQRRLESGEPPPIETRTSRRGSLPSS